MVLQELLHAGNIMGVCILVLCDFRLGEARAWAGVLSCTQYILNGSHLLQFSLQLLGLHLLVIDHALQHSCPHLPEQQPPTHHLLCQVQDVDGACLCSPYTDLELFVLVLHTLKSRKLIGEVVDDMLHLCKTLLPSLPMNRHGDFQEFPSHLARCRVATSIQDYRLCSWQGCTAIQS